jgi:topoisomerase-4 subunit A
VGEFRPTDRLLLINQRGLVKTVIPEITMHFDDDLIVMEKWEPKKPITAIHWAGEKGLFYVKRFLIDAPDKQENVLTDDAKSYLETIFTDYRPVAELVFTKERGKDRKDNLVIDLENFIALKGIGALGNQLTKYKILEINALEPLAFEPREAIPAAAIEVVDQQAIESSDSTAPQSAKETIEPKATQQKPAEDTSQNKEKEPPMGEDGQALLF